MKINNITVSMIYRFAITGRSNSHIKYNADKYYWTLYAVRRRTKSAKKQFNAVYPDKDFCETVRSTRLTELPITYDALMMLVPTLPALDPWRTYEAYPHKTPMPAGRRYPTVKACRSCKGMLDKEHTGTCVIDVGDGYYYEGDKCLRCGAEDKYINKTWYQIAKWVKDPSKQR